MFPKVNKKSLLECNEDDLIVLIDNPDYKENEYLDYKETFSFLQIKDKTQRNTKKVEFKNDVCSFANAEGGYLIFGVSDNNGCASELIGIDIPNDDIDRFELDRRNDLMGIQPKMPHLDFKFIKLKKGKYVVIIYIKHDSFAPYIHLEDQKNYKIYKRVGNRKDVLPYVELKNMFNQSIALDKEIYTYRNERIDYYASQTETEGDNYSRFLLFHIIPENFTDINYNKEMFILQKTKGIRFSSIFSQFGCAPFSVPCVDGLRFLPYSPARSNAEGYINNNGIVECFLPLSEDIKLNASSQYPQGYLPKDFIWDKINDVCYNYAKIYKEIYSEERVFLCLSIIGCKGIISQFPDIENFTSHVGSIDRNQVLCPPISIENIADENAFYLMIKKLHIEYLLSIGVKFGDELNNLIKEIYS